MAGFFIGHKLNRIVASSCAGRIAKVYSKTV